MVMVWKRRTSKADAVSLLDAVPVRAGHVLTETGEDQCVVLAIPRFKHRWMQRHLVPKGLSPYIRVSLEAHGTAVWQLIDGRRTVAEMISLLAPHFAGQTDYAARVCAYLIQLHRDGFIRLGLPSADHP